MNAINKLGLKKVGKMASIATLWILFMSTWVTAAPDHSIFGDLLAKYNQAGVVNYAGFKSEESKLDEYLGQLSRIDPESLSSSDRFAFYVNAYNAWTIKLILSAYPELKSIKDLENLFKSPWKRKCVDLKGKKVTLDHIEHDIIGFFELFAADELKSSIKARRATIKIAYLDYDWGLNGN